VSGLIPSGKQTKGRPLPITGANNNITIPNIKPANEVGMEESYPNEQFLTFVVLDKRRRPE